MEKNNRWACVSDLNNYFKKSDLLGGLTTLEQEQLKKNIGIINNDINFQSELINISYELLNDMIQNSGLLIGAKYLITDFQTIYSSNVFDTNGKRITWGKTINTSPVTPIIVTAISKNKIDSRVYYNTSNKNWIILYDSTKETLDDGVTTKGKIIYLKDNKNNSAFYDFKNIKFRRTSMELENSNLVITGSYIDLYTFSDITNGIVTDSSTLYNTTNNELKENAYNNIFLGDTYYNIIEPDCKNNTFIRGCHDTILKWNSTNNMFNEAVAYLTGSIYNLTFNPGNTDLSTSISKTVHKVNDATILSFLDPITYAYQVIILD